MAGKFVLKKSSNGKFYFRLQAGNGETLLMSEMYNAKPSAENGIASVKTNAPDDDRYERKAAKNGQAMFNLKAANGQVIGTSESYSSEAAREKGIASVKANAPDAKTDDQTAA
ncbi:MAG TPA: YegP family protein [Pseudolabrys sp.]|nr:YegP family protein [Pseudolabrys sp.]